LRGISRTGLVIIAEKVGWLNIVDRSVVERYQEEATEGEPPYLYFRRILDAVVAAISIFFSLPLLVLAAVAVALDVGSPILFWQQRIGRGGREFQIYKLRTLRPPFDRRGRRIPEEQRLSWIGRLLRETGIDELPQLLNVLVGHMSLIGLKPLPPSDQPSALRLTVRPGITGWAQVNGGAFLSLDEAEALDVWYIYNASPWLDLQILWLTLLKLERGDRRSEKAIARAKALQVQLLRAGHDKATLRQAGASQFPEADVGRRGGWASKLTRLLENSGLATHDAST
jgi:lipopolysaccharide/colanic/teichoic acid biosynthesis glycosyltransferase